MAAGRKEAVRPTKVLTVRPLCSCGSAGALPGAELGMRAPIYLSIHHARDWFCWECCLVEGFVLMHHHPKAPSSPCRLIVSSSTHHNVAMKDVLVSPP